MAVSERLQELRNAAAGDVYSLPEQAESIRQLNRRSVKDAAARGTVLAQHVAVLDDQIAGIRATIDDATNDHQGVCAPLQAELKKLETDAIRRIADRQPADVTADGRRAEIVKEIAAENLKLEEFAAAQNKLLATVEKSRSNTRGEVAGLPSLSRLAADDLGHPRLVAKKKALSNAIQWHSQRIGQAEKILRQVAISERENAIRRSDFALSTDATPQERLDRLRRDQTAVLELARDDRARAQAALDDVVQQLIDE